ncbi:hypothetical protein ACFSUM_09205 [Virgibacillus siamensis]|uniref:hypothetical protein n=1 Tax=Virgibacillus siamensis TaxID=480071 RepID=UPI0031D989E1
MKTGVKLISAPFIVLVYFYFKGVGCLITLENLVVTKPLGDSHSCTYAVRKFYTFLLPKNSVRCGVRQMLVFFKTGALVYSLFFVRDCIRVQTRNFYGLAVGN